MEFVGHREPLKALNWELPKSGCSIVKAEPTAIVHEPIPAPQPAGICPSGFRTPSHQLCHSDSGLLLPTQAPGVPQRLPTGLRASTVAIFLCILSPLFLPKEGPLPPVFSRHSCPRQSFLFLDFKSSHRIRLYISLVFLKAQHGRAGVSQRHPQVKQTDLGSMGICGGHSFRAGLTKWLQVCFHSLFSWLLRTLAITHNSTH